MTRVRIRDRAVMAIARWITAAAMLLGNAPTAAAFGVKGTDNCDAVFMHGGNDTNLNVIAGNNGTTDYSLADADQTILYERTVGNWSLSGVNEWGICWNPPSDLYVPGRTYGFRSTMSAQLTSSALSNSSLFVLLDDVRVGPSSQQYANPYEHGSATIILREDERILPIEPGQCITWGLKPFPGTTSGIRSFTWALQQATDCHEEID